MLNIYEKTHIATVINSLDKIYKQSKVNGELNPLDIYYMDIIYKLLYHCNIDISNENKNILINIYNNISFKSNFVCPNINIKPYHLNTKVNFTQAETTDCKDEPLDSGKIYYWQEESTETTYNDIIPLINQEYLNTKNSDTYTNFENGRIINYENVGRICFVDNNDIDFANYEITDSLGNDIGNFFTVSQIADENSVLIMSKNFYSFGEVFIKIKKTTNA